MISLSARDVFIALLQHRYVWCVSFEPLRLDISFSGHQNVDISCGDGFYEASIHEIEENFNEELIAEKFTTEIGDVKYLAFEAAWSWRVGFRRKDGRGFLLSLDKAIVKFDPALLEEDVKEMLRTKEALEVV